MSLLFAVITWLAPLTLLLVWQASQWREKHPEVRFRDWLHADPFIAGAVVGSAFLWLVPLGMWLLLIFAILYAAIGSLASGQQRREWSQRALPRLLTVVMLLMIHLMAGFIPPSEPIGEATWGEPFSTEPEESPLFPASQQYIWVLNDGAIVVETHMQIPGVLNPWLASSGMNKASQLSGTKEARFQEAVSLMSDWSGQDSFTLVPIHDGVRHDYDGQTLLYTHDDIMLDLFGMHPSGEMVTVFRPTWGGEMHLLTVIKMGGDPFVGNPGAQSYVEDWLAIE